MVKRTIVCWIMLSIISCMISGPEIHFTYYVNILPRLMDGFINDPFSFTNQGVMAMLRRSFLHDQVLNPGTESVMSNSAMHLIAVGFNASVFFLTSCPLLKRNDDASRTFFLLILMSTIISGYYNIYGFLLLAVFFPFEGEWALKKYAQFTSLLLVIAIPSSWVNDIHVLHDARFFLLITVWIMEIVPLNGMRPVLFRASFLAMIYILFTGGRIFEKHATGTPYYRADVLQDDYILGYTIRNDSLHAISYGHHGSRLISILFSGQETSGNISSDSTFFAKDGEHIISHVTFVNDSVIFLSDEGRGPGLFHLHVISLGDFRSLISGKNE
jgi:hypothetical protein